MTNMGDVAALLAMTNNGYVIWRLTMANFAGAYSGSQELVGFRRFDIRWPVC